jgi:carbamoyltransferase
MKILGIHDGHNATAALLEDGRIVAAVSEERLVRVKNVDCFPEHAIADCLDAAGCSAEDVDFVAFNGEHQPYSRTRDELMAAFRRASTPQTSVRKLLRRTPLNRYFRSRRRTSRLEDAGRVGLDGNRVRFVEHHRAHAYATYWSSPWREGPVLVLTCDGSGDDLCATVNVAEGGKIERIAAVHESHSLGIIYAMATTLLGMMPLEDEHKVMGMAPYGLRRITSRTEEDCFAGLLNVDGLSWERADGLPDAYQSFNYMKRRLGLTRFDNASASVQLLAENVIAAWAANCVRETGVKRVALSGGVFMNVKANKVIYDLPEVDELFVMPSCGDDSNAIGACYAVYDEERRRAGLPTDIPPLGPIYFGREFPDVDCERALVAVRRVDGVEVREPEDIEWELGRLVASGKVAARYAGRMEFGARALGNRSILADPRDMAVIPKINEMIKSRDFWMPFAPSVLAERSEEYAAKPKPMTAPYMIMAFDSTDKRDDFRAATHPYDKSTRPQEVFEDWNPGYYRVLKSFEDATGRGIVLNTSFNLHGYPIVYRPEEAVEVFLRSSLDALALGPYLIERE